MVVVAVAARIVAVVVPAEQMRCRRAMEGQLTDHPRCPIIIIIRPPR